MNKTKILLAATPALLASAALLLSFLFPVNADSLIVGYAAVLSLGGLAALEYRVPGYGQFRR